MLSCVVAKDAITIWASKLKNQKPTRHTKFHVFCSIPGKVEPINTTLLYDKRMKMGTLFVNIAIKRSHAVISNMNSEFSLKFEQKSSKRA